jgi:hypothetical protein
MIEFVNNSLCAYKHDYEKIFKDISLERVDPISIYKELILNDLFFTLFFVVHPFNPGCEYMVNHPFIVQACKDVEEGPKDFTLDLWARFHYKSSIITTAETIQYIAGNPELSTGIFSYANKPAKKFLFSIREICQNEKILHKCFPEIFWENPQKEAPMWSIDEGIILGRKSNRREPTVSAYGLTEGMPTGSHFERRIYDDIVTEDIGDSPDVMEKVKEKYDSSQNLTTDGGTHRVTGTPYHHNDPLNYIRNKKDIYDLNKPAYHLRLKTASSNDGIDGEPVLLSKRTYDNLKLTSTFACQQLLDPTPVGIRRLDSTLFLEIEPEFIPTNVYKFIVIDPAGDKEGLGGKRDNWAIGVFGVEPRVDDMGLSKVYLMDAIIETMGESEAPTEIARMYVKNSRIWQMGIEKVALSTTELHVSQALEKRRIFVSTENRSLVILRPGGRKKAKRIERALAYPLFNGKLFMSKAVPKIYRDKIKEEAETFPYGIHDDGLDMWSYLYDMINDFRFVIMDEEEQREEREKVGRNAVTGY